MYDCNTLQSMHTEKQHTKDPKTVYAALIAEFDYTGQN